MDSSERRSTKRSRFDQTEPEPKRVSRFDRRSRSPPVRRDDAARDRDHTSREPEASTSGDQETKRHDPAAAAAAIAARISEQLQTRKSSSRDIDESAAAPIATTSVKATASASAANINGEIYISDGDYIKDIEVNDQRNRYINPPLYLHITSTSKEGLQKAIDKVNELLHSELPPLVDERRFRRREREEQPAIERDEYGRKKWPDKQIPVNLEPIPGFNLRAQVVGHGGAYVKHIQQETGCRVQIKGRGSGFIESSTGRESDEPMYLHVTGPDPEMVEKAKELCEDLLENVKDQYESFKSRPQRSYGGQGGYGDRHSNGNHYGNYQGYSGGRGGYGGRGGRGGYNGYGGHGGHGGHDRDGNDHSGYNSPNSAAGNASSTISGHANRSPAPSATPATPAALPSGTPDAAVAAAASAGSADYAAQYAQYYGTNDPYAPYGGYAAYVQYYQKYYAAAQQAQQQQHATPTPPLGVAQSVTSPPPPPPPSDAPPPPPPPPSSDGPPPYPIAAPLSSKVPPPTASASLSFRGPPSDNLSSSTNPDPFLLSPILNLPPSFGSAYVGESFACTLCVNHDVVRETEADAGGGPRKTVRDVRIEAEMKTPSTAGVVKLDLATDENGAAAAGAGGGSGGVDLEAGQTLQNVVRFDLKEEGNHVLAVTVSYYEATETSGRTRTFRKLYQFICKSSLIVRTKAGPYAAAVPSSQLQKTGGSTPPQRWILEAQLENCGEDVLQLDLVMLQLEPSLTYEDCNDWDNEVKTPSSATGFGSRRPVLHPGEVEQVSFLIQETDPGLQEESNGRLVFGVLGIGWRGEMGGRGYLSTGKLGTRVVR
ncbi:hypothetical protein Sste5346_010282 [Sporothrix stenoceras]|uniref:K Homology domain-containing protein n=1 Tax=Sporothrix stenoceras TaxID=5173 RepID=A0ABR3YGQ9_9PEZI